MIVLKEHCAVTLTGATLHTAAVEYPQKVLQLTVVTFKDLRVQPETPGSPDRTKPVRDLDTFLRMFWGRVGSEVKILVWSERGIFNRSITYFFREFLG